MKNVWGLRMTQMWFAVKAGSSGILVGESRSGLKWLAAGSRNLCVTKLVVVFYVDAQATIRNKFSVSCRKLLFVMIQEEIESIVCIHVDKDQIRIVHDQLAEAQPIVPKRHVITGADIFHRLGIRTAKNLNNAGAFDSY